MNVTSTPPVQQQSSGKTGAVIGTTVGLGVAGAAGGYFMPVKEDQFVKTATAKAAADNTAKYDKLESIKKEISELTGEKKSLSEESKKYLKDNGGIAENVEDIAKAQAELDPVKSATAKVADAEKAITDTKEAFEAKTKAFKDLPEGNIIDGMDDAAKAAAEAKNTAKAEAETAMKEAQGKYRQALGITDEAADLAKVDVAKIQSGEVDGSVKTAKQALTEAEGKVKTAGEEAATKLKADLKSYKENAKDLSDDAKKQIQEFIGSAKKSKALRWGGIAAAAGLIISLLMPGKKAEETSENA